MATKTEVITFRTGPRMKAAAARLAEKREMTSGELARHALADYLIRHGEELDDAPPAYGEAAR